MVIVLSLTLMAAALFLYVTPPTYVATANLVIDSRKVQTLNPATVTRNDVIIDDPVVVTELELLRSEDVGRGVIAKLHLTEDPDWT
jgi:polysaccharide biosynthesis transport protein